MTTEDLERLPFPVPSLRILIAWTTAMIVWKTTWQQPFRRTHRTGVVGKWHLHTSDRNTDFVYTEAQDKIRSCGFDYAEAIYPENLNGVWIEHAGPDVDIDHNMEHVTSKALEFMESAIADEEPFFLYLNPTVPHSSGNVRQVLRNYDCRHTVEGAPLDVKPHIGYGRMAGTVDDVDCSAYRETVMERAETNDDKELGMIWIDDAIESILEMLTHYGQLDNTFFLFQMDHGQEGKGSLYEPGVRIAQFIHYPNGWGGANQLGTTFDGLVSTIDIGPTMLEIAGLKDQHYEMDGESWLTALQDEEEYRYWTEDRCLFFEMDNDRAVRCGCHKFMTIDAGSSGTWDKANNMGYTLAGDNLFDLCSDDSSVLEFDGTVLVSNSFNDGLVTDMINRIDCHNVKTNPSDTPDYQTSCDGAQSVCTDSNDGRFYCASKRSFGGHTNL